MFLLIDK